MLLKDIVLDVREVFPRVEENKICQLINELEKDIIGEIFSPYGIPCRTEPLDFQSSLKVPLLLGDEHKNLYLDYIFSRLTVEEGDLQDSNTYSALFNKSYENLIIKTRRKNRPIKSTLLSGRGI